ncbi:MAG TPA: phage tail tape measure protein, partial [Blastocatellia bacterium]
MASEVFQLAILLSLKDAASGGLERFADRLRATGKEGKEALESIEELRGNLSKGLEIGAVGLEGIEMLHKGIDTAAEFESAFTDLRMAIGTTSADGAVNLAKLNNEMSQFEDLGMRLGNTLPGSIKDFTEGFTALRESGISTADILAGVGEMEAKLALTSHMAPKELAPDFGELVKMFDLHGLREFKEAGDIVSKLQTIGMRPGELIGGLKFLQLRAGTSL